MKKGILILAHGSRERETEIVFNKIADMTKEKVNEAIIETAFLQFSDVNLEKGLDNLIARGVKEIKVIPYFLFSGVHIRENIPKKIEKYLEDKPNIKVIVGEVLGDDSRLADILADKINKYLD